jgi:hypothetical protein
VLESPKEYLTPSGKERLKKLEAMSFFQENSFLFDKFAGLKTVCLETYSSVEKIGPDGDYDKYFGSIWIPGSYESTSSSSEPSKALPRRLAL